MCDKWNAPVFSSLLLFFLLLSVKTLLWYRALCVSYWKHCPQPCLNSSMWCTFFIFFTIFQVCGQLRHQKCVSNSDRKVWRISTTHSFHFNVAAPFVNMEWKLLLSNRLLATYGLYFVSLTSTCFCAIIMACAAPSWCQRFAFPTYNGMSSTRIWPAAKSNFWDK